MTDAIREGMAMEDFLKAINEQPFELINGERIDRMPGTSGHSELIHFLFLLLHAFCKERNLGVVRMETSFVLPDRYDATWVAGSRVPDLMFIESDRFSEYTASDEDWRDKPLLIVPDLVVEVLSPNDVYSAVDAKVDAYRQDGVRLIWLVDPQRKKVTVHRLADIQPEIKTQETTLSGEDVLPDFTVPLTDIFKDA